MTKNTKRWIYSGVAALTLAVAGLVAWANIDVAAASVDSPVAASFSEDGGQDVSRRGRGGRGQGNIDRGALMAEALGITEEEYDAAKEDALEAAIDDAVENGDLTQEDADAILAGEARFPRDARPDKEAANAYLADALGISVDELDAARQAAQEAGIQQLVDEGILTEEEVALMEARQALKTYIDREAIVADVLGVTVEDLDGVDRDGIAQLLEDAGLDRDAFQEAVQAEVDAAVDQAIEDGVITQEQVDQLEEQGRNRRGGNRGNGQRGGNGNGQAPVAPTDAVDA